jgi:ABC-type branched-subunit amino acid transport system ATPase component
MMLSISSLNAAYEHKRVLKDLSLKAAAGEITALIGPNGAGKTTVIRAVSGTIPIQSGEVLINGKNLSGFSNAERARARNYRAASSRACCWHGR